MQSQREIEREYQKHLENPIYQEEIPDNRVNCYTCKNGHITKTIDIAIGTTPFIIHCKTEGCSCDATSSFYKDIAPYLQPTHEWFRPTVKETIKFRNKNPGMVDHILMGGLDLRPIKS